MHCPFCNAAETRVIDSRLISSGNQIRRRRECSVCQERFSTFEVAELIMPKVIKRDGARVPFDEHKLRTGLLRALEKRPVAVEEFEAAFAKISYLLRDQGEREISSTYIGETVMQVLQSIDQVAYVRFASVYRQFEDVSEFSREIQKLQSPADEKEGDAS